MTDMSSAPVAVITGASSASAKQPPEHCTPPATRSPSSLDGPTASTLSPLNSAPVPSPSPPTSPTATP